MGLHGCCFQVVGLGVSVCLVRAIMNILGANNRALGKDRVLVYVREKKMGPVGKELASWDKVLSINQTCQWGPLLRVNSTIYARGRARIA